MKARDAAFPTVVYHPTDDTIYGDYGMTLRDWFAGQALGGMVSEARPASASEIAHAAYKLADAMLTERERTP